MRGVLAMDGAPATDEPLAMNGAAALPGVRARAGRGESVARAMSSAPGVRARVCRVLLVLTLLTGGMVWAHAVYIGHAQGEVSGSEFRGKLAYNKLDLLQALAGLQGDELYTLQPFELEELTLRYLSAHFQAVADTDTLALEIVGREQKGDVVIFAFRFSAPQPLPPLHSLRVRNDVLFELFSQQVNTLALTVAGVHSRYVFHPDKRVVELTW